MSGTDNRKADQDALDEALGRVPIRSPRKKAEIKMPFTPLPREQVLRAVSSSLAQPTGKVTRALRRTTESKDLAPLRKETFQRFKAVTYHYEEARNHIKVKIPKPGELHFSYDSFDYQVTQERISDIRSLAKSNKISAQFFAAGTLDVEFRGSGHLLLTRDGHIVWLLKGENEMVLLLEEALSSTSESSSQ